MATAAARLLPAAWQLFLFLFYSALLYKAACAAYLIRIYAIKHYGFCQPIAGVLSLTSTLLAHHFSICSLSAPANASPWGCRIMPKPVAPIAHWDEHLCQATASPQRTVKETSIAKSILHSRPDGDLRKAQLWTCGLTLHAVV
eukprot:6209783-Pleurochrysis_carterae.AAC.1